jgi:acetolactate synthase-1/2/3 large subunit
MKHHDLPIKLIIINNDGYLSIKISQKTFFNSRFVASEKNSGVSLPSFQKLIAAYELPYYRIEQSSEIDGVLTSFLNHEGPAVCEVFTSPNETHEPKVVARLGADGKFIPGELKNIQWIES